MRAVFCNSLYSIVAASVLIVSQPSLGSSGGGFDQSGFSQRKIDQVYEQGKSYYKSRQADGSRLEYCVKNGEKLAKLSRKSVKRFKKGPASEFVDSLFNCAKPLERIVDVVPDGQGDSILHYLNKRFKLRLKSG